jgi:pyruvate dehydrogenase E2 component (dihydrolipoamide acetyltransferase)
MTLFRLPDLGEGLVEAEIVSWLVSVGDHVVADQPLVSVETSKAVVEIPSPQAGRIAGLLGKPGEMLAVGAPLVEFDDRGGEARAGDDAGAIVGTLDTGDDGASPGEVKAAPAVRRFAEQKGVDLSTIKPTGPDGTVTRADIEFAARRGAPGAADAEPLRGVRRVMAQVMTGAHEKVVPATVTDDADVEEWPEGADVTVRLIRALIAAAKAVPTLNASFDGHAMTRRMNDDLHLGLAIDTVDGLFVPVIEKSQTLDDAALRREVGRLRRAVEERQLPPSAFSGATITLSNFGMLGGRYATMVVVPPQVAILGAGRIFRRAQSDAEGRVHMRRQLPLSLTFDHRAITGGEAARFLATVIETLRG